MKFRMSQKGKQCIDDEYSKLVSVFFDDKLRNLRRKECLRRPSLSSRLPGALTFSVSLSFNASTFMCLLPNRVVQSIEYKVLV